MSRFTPFDAFSRATFPSGFTAAVFLLRLFIGILFFWSGFSKLFGEPAWSAAPYLLSASGPFAEFFKAMAGLAVIDGLNVWGQLLIGSALLLGLCVRPGAFFGAIMMVFYYLAHFEQNIMNGYVDLHVILFFVFLL